MSLRFVFSMISSSNSYCHQIISIIQSHGVKTAYCSPGSRNAPLLLALDSNTDIHKHVVVDERSAAFQALGCALLEQRPVLLVCTSGTAVLNYAPAVAEAYYAGVPLIVVSADRPREWIDQDDSQVIRQFGVLQNFVKGSYDILDYAGLGSNRHVDRWTVNRTVNEAMLKALDGKPGPVHINVQLSDPLGEICECDLPEERHVKLTRSAETLSARVLTSLAGEAFNSKILVVAGFGMPDNSLIKAMRMFASLPNVAVMAETISNLRGVQPMAEMIDSVLCRMSETDKERLRPDIVISFGGALVSRMLKQYLRNYPPKRHWSVGHSNYFGDCFQSLSEMVDVSPDSFFRQMYGALNKKFKVTELDYANDWSNMRRAAVMISEDYIRQSPWSDLTAIDYILKHLPLDNLFVSNGTSVRYSQLIPHKCHAEYCNRGVSGIDGTTATAVGAANAYLGETTLLTGDMSWLYDSGASTLFNVPIDMRIIVIDNMGGGIFRFIKSTNSISKDILNHYFCVDNEPDIESIAEGYGFDVRVAENMKKLKDTVRWLSKASYLPRLLIVQTPPDVSAKVLKSYFNPNPSPLTLNP